MVVFVGFWYDIFYLLPIWLAFCLVLTLIYEYSSMAEFDAASKEHPEFARVLSPGGCIGGKFKSRTAVYQAVKRGKLDMIRINERFGSLILLIPVSSLENYEATAKVGRPPKTISVVNHAVDRLAGHW